MVVVFLLITRTTQDLQQCVREVGVDKLKKELELYIHIPFCVKKCVYCDFLSFETSGEEQARYVNALLREIEQYAVIARKYRVTTIFVGGGTPSILEGEYLRAIFDKVRETFVIEEDAEITIEVNPGTVTEEKVMTYKSIGINRVSIGLQATDDEELKLLGRIHCYEEFLETYHLFRKHGMTNINVDLISAIPKQTVKSWEETMNKVIALEPTHISAYSLIIEEGTSLYENLSDYEKWLPSEEEERNMYHLTKSKLEDAEYVRYEISNYSKKGYECRHNLGYWERTDYLGIGLGSSSLLDNVRYSNETDMEQYCDKCEKQEPVRIQQEILAVQAQKEEFMFLGLRRIEGVFKERFRIIFDESIETVYGDVIANLQEKGLLEETEESLRLTEYGIDVSNYVMSEFLME